MEEGRVAADEKDDDWLGDFYSLLKNTAPFKENHSSLVLVQNRIHLDLDSHLLSTW